MGRDKPLKNEYQAAMPRNAVGRTALLGVTLALALGTYALESALPPIVPALPGARLGLSNVFVLFTLCALGPWAGLLLTLGKCLVGPLLAGSASGIPYSLAGGVLAWGAMRLGLRYGSRFLGLVGVSVLGAACHAAGQVLVSVWVTGTPQVLSYLPLLTGLSSVTGVFVGLCAFWLWRGYFRWSRARL